MAARLVRRQLMAHRLGRTASTRSFTAPATVLEAHSFTMPAMSPTMTEGNIARWKVGEGDAFSAGDVLLDIETDKANMDVEAQDDGIVAKIIHANGAKGISVGSRIAVFADPGDDIQSLHIPPDDAAGSRSAGSAKESTKTPSSDSPASSKAPSGHGPAARYPLYPAVAALMHQHHLGQSDLAEIPATGPNSRLLKGDVLAYLGQIPADYASSQSERIQKLSHLDLSTVKKAVPAPAGSARASPSHTPPSTASQQAASAAQTTTTTVSLPISLSEVAKVRKNLSDTLHISPPLSELVVRAVDYANDHLPKPKHAAPTSDELFNAIVNRAYSIPTTSRGNYQPQISPPISTPPSTSPSSSSTTTTTKPRPKTPDIIDILTTTTTTTNNSNNNSNNPPNPPPHHQPQNQTQITLTVPSTEKHRARTFLLRVKSLLQREPGRLFL